MLQRKDGELALVSRIERLVRVAPQKAGMSGNLWPPRALAPAGSDRLPIERTLPLLISKARSLAWLHRESLIALESLTLNSRYVNPSVSCAWVSIFS